MTQRRESSTTGEAFAHLLSPLQIGSATLRNRIVSAGHDTVLPAHGMVSEELIAYHEARAAGGVGMIIVQVAAVHESARYTSHMLMAVDDECIPGYRRLADACHRHGTVIVGQSSIPAGRSWTPDGRRPVAYSAATSRPSASTSYRGHSTRTGSPR